MSTLQQFTRLPLAVQRRILKVARQVERMTFGGIKFDDTVEAMTGFAYNRHQSRKEYRHDARIN